MMEPLIYTMQESRQLGDGDRLEIEWQIDTESRSGKVVEVRVIRKSKEEVIYLA